VAPIPEAQYERVLELWPAYDFKSYDERTENTECLPDESSGAAGAGGAGGASGDSGGAAGSE
jgi:hypothetical protein